MSMLISTIETTALPAAPDAHKFLTHLVEFTVGGADCMMSGDGQMLAEFHYPKLVKTMEEFCASQNSSAEERKSIMEWIDSLPWDDCVRVAPKEERSDSPNKCKVVELYFSM